MIPPTEEIVGFQLGQRLDHPVLASVVELANDVGADVGGRHQDAEEISRRCTG